MEVGEYRSFMKEERKQGNVSIIIESHKSLFTKSEKKIAAYILKESENIIYNNIETLAGKLKIGEATLIRFCKKLGYSGYLAFKVDLVREVTKNSLEPSIKEISSVLGENDSVKDILRKISFSSVNTLKEGRELLNPKDVEKAVKILDKSRIIYFYGLGMSSSSVLEAKYKFMRIGYKVDAYTDNHMLLMNSSLLSKNDVVVGISYGGRTIDIVEALKNAQERGAGTICITRYPQSPITKYADIVLINGGREAPLEGGAFNTKIAQLFVIDVLYCTLMLRNKEKVIQRKEITNKAIESKLF